MPSRGFHPEACLSISLPGRIKKSSRCWLAARSKRQNEGPVRGLALHLSQERRTPSSTHFSPGQVCPRRSRQCPLLHQSTTEPPAKTIRGNAQWRRRHGLGNVLRLLSHVLRPDCRPVRQTRKDYRRAPKHDSGQGSRSIPAVSAGLELSRLPPGPVWLAEATSPLGLPISLSLLPRVARSSQH